MKTYVERRAEMERHTRPVEYVTNDEYRRQKAALTRAVNSGDPRKVLATVEKTVGEWSGKAWPDDWNRWRIALEDAAQRLLTQRYETDISYGDYEERLALRNELVAASHVLFRF